jgi:AcrR family transcriptional regulator
VASDFRRDELKAAIRQQVVEITAQETAKALAKQAAKHPDVHAHLAGHLESLDVWLRRRETRRPRLSQDDIAEAALRLADAEGLEAVSMRRLAVELGVGTMSLYHYVRTKDELLTLLTDHVLGEINLAPGTSLPATWQEAVRVIAERSLAALRRHPWVLDISDDPPFGPNGVRHFDQSLQAVTTYPGTDRDRFDLLAAIDEFVFGFALKERANYSDHGDAPPGLLDYLSTLLASGEFHAIEALVERYGLVGSWEMISGHGRDPDRFGRELQRLIAGFEATP